MSPESDSQSGWTVVNFAVASAQRLCADRFESAYAIGSLAHGGFTAVASDVDVAILVNGETSVEATMRAVSAAVHQELQTELAERLSIFHSPWTCFSAPTAGSRFPAIDRLDLMRHGVLVAGNDRRSESAAAPARAEVVREAVEFAASRWSADGLRAALRPENLADTGLRDITKLILSPVRLLFVVHTGNVGSNDDAADHYAAVPGVTTAKLVRSAIMWRRRGRLDEVGGWPMLEIELLRLYHEVLAILSQIDGLPSADAIATLETDFARQLASRVGG